MSPRIRPIRPQDIRSLTEFQRTTRRCVDRLRRTGRPELLTVNGKACIVVQDADAYQRVLELADRMETLLAVREGLDSMGEAQGISIEELDRGIEAGLGVQRASGTAGTKRP